MPQDTKNARAPIRNPSRKIGAGLTTSSRRCQPGLIVEAWNGLQDLHLDYRHEQPKALIKEEGPESPITLSGRQPKTIIDTGGENL